MAGAGGDLPIVQNCALIAEIGVVHKAATIDLECRFTRRGMVSRRGGEEEQRCRQRALPNYKMVARGRLADGAAWPFCFQVDTRGQGFSEERRYVVVMNAQK
jgi:hypothetical protein